MHTFTASDGTVFIYNPDLSDVRINVINEHIEDISYMTDMTTAEPLSQVHVSGPALREFMFDYFRKTKEDQRTKQLIEQATRPLNQKISRLEKDVRRLKSDLAQTKNVVNRLTK